MTKLKSLPSYADVLKDFGRPNDSFLPAQIHGFICGILCGMNYDHEHLGFKTVLNRLLEEGISSQEAKSRLAELMLVSSQQLESFDFEFYLFLPNEDETLNTRIEAVSGWCQDFLSGLGLANLPEKVLSHPNVQEAIKDLSDITYSHCDDSLSKDEAEAAYAELVEFVRVAVLLVHTQAYLGNRQQKKDDNPLVH